MAESAKEFFFAQWNRHDIFCVYHYPVEKDIRRQILYVHPFGDEMNKARRMVSLMASVLAENGIAVLIIDLFGCGDSSGELSDVDWEHWLENIYCAYEWLKAENDVPVMLWGLRLGCLLIGDFLNRFDVKTLPDLILWQPVLAGKQWIRQLRRQYSLSQIIGNAKPEGLDQLITNQGYIEISGYEIGKSLFTTLESIDLKTLVPEPGTRVIWKEILLLEKSQLNPASVKLTEAWIQSGVQIDWEIIVGKPFWNTVEIEVCHDLITSTISSVVEKIEKQ